MRVEMSWFRVSDSITNQHTSFSAVCVVVDVHVYISLPVPSPEVMVSSPTESELVSGSPLSLTCSIQPRGDSSVDTPTTVMSSWDAPNSAYDRVNTVNEMSVGLVISSVQTADSGDYMCSASVTDSSDSVYVVDSDTATYMVNIIASKSVKVCLQLSVNRGDKCIPTCSSSLIQQVICEIKKEIIETNKKAKQLVNTCTTENSGSVDVPWNHLW